MKIILIVLFLVVVTVSIAHFQKKRIDARQEARETSELLRLRWLSGDFLESSPSDDARGEPESNEVKAAAMDWTVQENITATLLVSRDGSVSFYYSTGGGMIGLGADANVKEAASHFLERVAAVADSFSQADEYPFPETGAMKFYAITRSGTVCSESVSTQILQKGQHPHSSLGSAADDVLTEIRKAE